MSFRQPFIHEIEQQSIDLEWLKYSRDCPEQKAWRYLICP